jgi:hypothetical protein
MIYHGIFREYQWHRADQPVSANQIQTTIEPLLACDRNLQILNYLCNIIVMDFGALHCAGAAVSFRSAIHLQFWSARQLC